jgi:hypothetical protein
MLLACKQIFRLQQNAARNVLCAVAGAALPFYKQLDEAKAPVLKCRSV